MISHVNYSFLQNYCSFKISNKQYGQSVVQKDKTLSAGGIRTHNHVRPKPDAPHHWLC